MAPSTRSEGRGHRFESCRVRQTPPNFCPFFRCIGGFPMRTKWVSPIASPTEFFLSLTKRKPVKNSCVLERKSRPAHARSASSIYQCVA